MLSSSLVQFALAAVALVAPAAAHPGHDHPMDAVEFHRRQLESQTRHLAARNCEQHVARYQAERKAKRSGLSKRAEEHELEYRSQSSPIKKFTCVGAPEVTEGPYYINNEKVRYDLSESQGGVPLTLDIGVIDIETCKPLPNVFVELWMANATGVYGGYPAQLGGGGGGGGPPPSGTGGPRPTGGGGGPGGPGGGSQPLVRNETFLRGGLATGPLGVVELKMIYTGFYQGRTPHIHTMVHTNWKKSANGTIISHAGAVSHIGQFFFEESWNDKVFALPPYTSNTNNRTYNSEDSIYAEENADGNDANIDIVPLSHNISHGLIGFVTMGVNKSAVYSINNSNYFNSTG